MTGGFDEWATARTPSLLAFAAALVEDGRGSADAAVTSALERIRPVWDRVSRADPDLEARRQVVRACATPRRAAAVLRALEERSDAEIAEILDCSESAARRHVERGLAEADQRPESPSLSVREQLVARAGSAPTQLLTRPLTRAGPEEPPPRRRGAWLGVLTVLVLVGGVAFISHETRTPDGVITYPRIDVPPTWRYESYAGVELQVPDTWGWGASPVRSDHFAGPQHLGACGSNQASVLSPADDSTYVSVFSGFVGRPAITNDRCVGWGSDGSYPYDNAVWFDSPLSVGVKPLGGTIAETRQIGGQHVTVFANEASVRRQILGSARQVDVDGNGCPTQPVNRPTAGPRDLQPESMSVCVYSQDTGVSTLMWSGSVPATVARTYSGVVGEVADDSTGGCSTPSGRWVALGLQGSGGTRWDVADLECGRIVRAGHESAPLTPGTVSPWAFGGATAYLSAPRGTRDLDQYFIAPPS